MQETELKGSKLYRYATMLEIGQKADFKYARIKDAINAAAGAGNCRLREGTVDSIAIKRWTSVTGEFYVTVAKIGRYDVKSNAPVYTDFENNAIVDAANRSLVKMLLEDGFTTMDILTEVEGWSEERTIEEVERVKLELEGAKEREM